MTTTKSKYKTKQREAILAFFRSSPGQHLTVSDLRKHLQEQGETVGTTTIYRHLEKMVDEGLVNKYTIDKNSSACFEYIDRSIHTPGETCFHCKCEKCGKLIHLHCDELNAFQSHLMDHHRFSLDPLRTVFYGVCEECMEKEKENE